MTNEYSVIERLIRLEVELQQIKEVTPLLKELHQDMIERRATQSVLKSTSKYFIWFLVGILSLLGYSKAPAVAEWLKDLPK
jgi:hypothetical protein